MQKFLNSPELRWHAICLSILLIVCFGLLAAGWVLTKQLKEPYQTRTPSSVTTPWLHTTGKL